MGRTLMGDLPVSAEIDRPRGKHRDSEEIRPTSADLLVSATLRLTGDVPVSVDHRN